jgi:iron(III) transport system substrate-binding protein
LVCAINHKHFTPDKVLDMLHAMNGIINKLNSVTRVAAMVACVTTLLGCQTAAPQQSAAGELVVYTSRSEALFKPVIEAFNAAYPNIKVSMLSGSNGALAAKILEEANTPQADILVNSDTLTMEDLAAKGTFMPNASKAVQAVPETYRAADGTWASLTLRPRVIMYNTTLVKPEELPKSVFELTDPKWKGQVGSANSTNGALIANLVALRKYAGAEKTAAFVKGLVANDTKFFGGHTEVRKAVGAGELKLGFVNHYYYYLSKAEGAPVGIVYPDLETFGLIVNSTNIGIVKNAKNAERAKLFVDFMLSADGQKIFAEKNFEYPIVPNVALAQGVAPLSAFKIADITLKEMFDDLRPTIEMAQQAGLP